MLHAKQASDLLQYLWPDLASSIIEAKLGNIQYLVVDLRLALYVTWIIVVIMYVAVSHMSVANAGE